jgi:hypothetical protein
MGPMLYSASLFANMPPPSYEVTIPRDRETIYEVAAPLFVALAIAAGGLWYARRHTLRSDVRRALLWLSGGCLAVAYSSWWMWDHRNAGIVEPNLVAIVAVAMPGLWMFCCAVIFLTGPRPRGGGSGQGSPKQLESSVELKSEIEETSDQVVAEKPVDFPSELLQQAPVTKTAGEKTNCGWASVSVVISLVFIAVGLADILWESGFAQCFLLVLIVLAIGVIVSRQL